MPLFGHFYIHTNVLYHNSIEKAIVFFKFFIFFEKIAD